MSYACRAAALVLTVVIFAANANLAHAIQRDRSVKVATYNMYIGADLADIFQTQTPQDLLAEVAEAFSDAMASNAAERADAVARQIEATRPVLVGLQEVALWRTGPVFDPSSAEDVAIDQLRSLLDALQARGLNYAPIAVHTNLDAELPGVFSPTAALDIRFTDRLVILARTDLKTSEFKLESVETGGFTNVLPIASPTLGTLTIPRGWASADVKFRGKPYRFITTHLESFYEPIQFAQAMELLSGPANSDGSVILAGDINSDAEAAGLSYEAIRDSGFEDAFAAVNNNAGNTWPLSAESTLSFLSPTQRIDVVMVRGAIHSTAADVLGEDVADATASGHRPSDHAGVVASLVLEPRVVLATCSLDRP